MGELKTIFFLFLFLFLSYQHLSGIQGGGGLGVGNWQKPGLQYQGRQKRSLNKDQSEALFQTPPQSEEK